MSDPTIWDIAMGGNPPEKFVHYADYARLKAEVERLKNNCDYLDQKLDEELDKSAMLCGHVERLTKAGDAMAEELVRLEAAFNGIESAEAQIWYIAKEGGCP
jgi:hypothetical protein